MHEEMVRAELSTSVKINKKLTIFHREAYTISSEVDQKKKAQMLIDLSKNIFLFALRSQFPLPNNNFNWYLSQLVAIYYWSQVKHYDFFRVNLNQPVQRKRCGPQFQNCRKLWSKAKYSFRWRFENLVPKVNKCFFDA